eukprot:5988198-Prymnesium_polylepis.1
MTDRVRAVRACERSSGRGRQSDRRSYVRGSTTRRHRHGRTRRRSQPVSCSTGRSPVWRTTRQQQSVCAVGSLLCMCIARFAGGCAPPLGFLRAAVWRETKCWERGERVGRPEKVMVMCTARCGFSCRMRRLGPQRERAISLSVEGWRFVDRTWAWGVGCCGCTNRQRRVTAECSARRAPRSEMRQGKAVDLKCKGP